MKRAPAGPASPHQRLAHGPRARRRTGRDPRPPRPSGVGASALRVRPRRQPYGGKALRRPSGPLLAFVQQRQQLRFRCFQSPPQGGADLWIGSEFFDFLFDLRSTVGAHAGEIRLDFDSPRQPLIQLSPFLDYLFFVLVEQLLVLAQLGNLAVTEVPSLQRLGNGRLPVRPPILSL